MRILLKRAIPVTAYKAVMEIGEIKKDYDFYLSVLELQEEFNEITPELVNVHLLQRNPQDVIGHRIVQMMVQYRLITTTSGDGQIQLTKKGMQLVQNLREEKYQLMEIDLIDILIQDKIISRNSRGQYEPIGNNKYGLLFDIENKGEIRSKFRGISKFLEQEQYLIPPELHFKITEIGKEALDREKVPIAQSSSYIIFTTEDILLDDNHIIAYEPINLKEWTRDENFIKKPSWLNNLIGTLANSPKILHLAAQDQDEIYLYGVEGEMLQSDKKINVNASLVIDESNKIELTISRDKKKPHAFENKIDLSFESAIMFLQKIIPYRISKIGERYALLVPYKDIKKNNWIDKNTIDYQLNNFDFLTFGEFEEIILESIDILPSTEDDAIDWAKDLIIGTLSYYFTEEDYEKKSIEISNKFSPRFSIYIHLPSFQAFSEEISRKKSIDPKTYWFLNTPRCLTFYGD
jgi:hypothetical protein